MADKFLDEAAGGLNNGGSGDDAWQTWAAAVAGATDGDDVWVRRTTNTALGASLALTNNTPESPIRYIGWPRPAISNTTITQADFTNGSRIIDNIVGITPSRTQHTARYITAPDGKLYMLTAVLWEAGVDGMAGADEFTVGSHLTNTTQTKKGKVWAFTDNLDTTGIIQYVRDSATAWVEDDNIIDGDGGDAEIDAGGEIAVGFLLDREYAGSTATGTDGKFQIEADEDYVDRPVVAQAVYDADAIDLPLIDFNDGFFRVDASSDAYNIFKNIEFKDSSNTYGIVYCAYSTGLSFIGCLFKQTTQNTMMIRTLNRNLIYFRQLIMEGSGSGAGQVAIFSDSGEFDFKDVVIFNMGDHGISSYKVGKIYGKNVNIGVEIPNGDADILVNDGNLFVKFIDTELGGTNGYVSIANATSNANTHISVENYQKVLGNHKTWFAGGEYISTAVSGETPNEKLSAKVLKISPNVNNFVFYEQDWKVKIPLGEINADAGSQEFKFWIYNGLGVTLNDGDALANFNLAAEYVSSYGDPTAYTMATIRSAEHTIAVPADADDWDYLSVTPTIAVESKIRLWLEISVYSAAGYLIVDPQVVIT